MNTKRIVSAALCAAMLMVPAIAAGTEGGDTPAADPGMCVGLPLAPGGGEGKADDRGSTPVEQAWSGPVMVYGRAVELGEGSVRLQNDNPTADYSDIVLNVGEDTIILDAVTGESRTFADLKENESLYAYAGPVMTRSLPPISNAVLILCNFPADFMAPTYAEVQQAIPGEDGKVSFLMTGDIVLHLSADTELLSYGSKDGAELAGIVPGTRLLSWYSMVMESYPAQAVPTKVMVFPYSYGGYLEIGDMDDISLNGEKLDIAPVVAEDGTLMLPVRAFAEALGCTVGWNAADPGRVTVEKDGLPVYSFLADAEEATVEGDMVMALAAPVLTRDKTAYLAAKDLLDFHGLKLVGSWPV